MNLTKRPGLGLDLLTLFILLSQQCLFAQNFNENIEDEIATAQNEGQQGHYAEEVADILEDLKQNPININSADRDGLGKIFFLSDFQINSIIDYRRSNGPVLSKFEIPYIFGFDQQLTELILPYITFGENDERMPPKKTKHLFIHKSVFNVHQEKINENLPARLYNRYTITGNLIQAGIVMENDPFEDFFKASNKTGFDHYVGYICLTPSVRFINKIIVGDFQTAFGQGLNMWNGFSPGKSTGTYSIRRRPKGIKPYKSSNEYLYMRGIATSFSFSDMEVNVFASSTKEDATLYGDTTGTYFSSLNETGLHRTTNEVALENNLGRKVYGFNIGFNKSIFRAGITYHNTVFSEKFDPRGRIDKQFITSGKNSQIVGADASVFLKNTIFFTEVSSTRNKSFAFLTGFTQKIPLSNEISVLYRNYDKGYFSFYAAAFGENNENRNEEGVFFSLKNQILYDLTVYAYADYFKIPWLSYQTIKPYYGNEHAVLAQYRFSENVEMGIKYKNERKELSFSNDDTSPIKQQGAYLKNSFRLQIKYNFTDNMMFSNRIESNSYRYLGKKSNGFLLYHDIKYSFKKVPVIFYTRYTMFDAELFDNRVYQYENDLKYNFYVPFLYGRGSKVYGLVKYEPNKYTELYFKTEYISYLEKNNDLIFKISVVMDII